MSAFLRSLHHGQAAVVKNFSHVEIPVQPDEIEPDSDDLTCQPHCNYPVLRRKSRHRWTLEQREVLCVLHRWYTNSWEELASVFNNHFSTAMQTNDLTLKVTGGALSAQLYEMQHYGVNAEAFRSVFIETLFVDEFCAWTGLKRDLEQTAKRTSITMKTRSFEDKGDLVKRCSQMAERMKRKRATNDTDGVLGHVAYQSEDGGLLPKTPRKQLKMLATPPTTPKDGAGVLTHGGPHPYSGTEKSSYIYTPVTPQSRRRSLRDVLSLPYTSSREESQASSKGNERKAGKWPRIKIAFRFYDDNSSGLNQKTSIRAGSFQNSQGKVPPPPAVDSEAFRKEAKKHFGWTREPTPFISMHESMLPVLHRGFQSNANASVTIINIRKVVESQQRNGSRLYAAAHIIKQHGLSNEVYGYRGRSEWVVWGVVDHDAIVTTFKIEHLRKQLIGAPDVQIVLRFPEIESAKNAEEYRAKLNNNVNHVSKASGRVVGKFLAFTGMPDPYINTAAKKIARDWALTGKTSLPRLRRFLEGVELGRREHIGFSAQVQAQSLTEYLKQVDSGLQRKGATNVNVPAKQAQPKPQMTDYLRQIDRFEYPQQIKSSHRRDMAELKKTARGNFRPDLASYLEQVDLGLPHAETGGDRCRESKLAPGSDDFLLKRRHIDRVCSKL